MQLSSSVPIWSKQHGVWSIRLSMFGARFRQGTSRTMRQEPGDRKRQTNFLSAMAGAGAKRKMISAVENGKPAQFEYYMAQTFQARTCEVCAIPFPVLEQSGKTSCKFGVPHSKPFFS